MNESQPPDYDEDAEECNDGMLLDGHEKSPFVTKNDQDICDSLSSFFANAWIH